MWYVVDLLFAQEQRPDRSTVTCEMCNVLFDAPSALDACRKAIPWAEDHSQDTLFSLVGIQNVRSLDEAPGDGVEIGGSFFDEADPWGRKDELIPDLSKMGTIMFESNPDKPIGEMMTEETKKRLRDILGEE
jgi:hypothetical protein